MIGSVLPLLSLHVIVHLAEFACFHTASPAALQL